MSVFVLAMHDIVDKYIYIYICQTQGTYIKTAEISTHKK